jgi:hypothetical protein
MMDIVERLRFYVPKSVADFYSAPEQVMSDAADKIEQFREALQEMVNEKCEYMHINHFGNPETTHTIKLARKALGEKE